MRKNLAIFQASPRRLLTLLLIASLIASTLVSVVEGKRSQEKLSKEQIRRCEQNIKYETKLQLFNKCSNMFVSFSPYTAGKSGANVAANGDGFDDCDRDKTILKVHSWYCNISNSDTPTVLVRIMRSGSQESLCFRKSGRLFKKDVSVAQCVFIQEKLEDFGFGGEMRYRSALYPEFFIGFDRRGRSINGKRMIGTARQQCSHFGLREVEGDSNTSRITRKHKIRHGKDRCMYRPKYIPKSPRRKRRRHHKREQRLRNRYLRQCIAKNGNPRKCRRVREKIAQLDLGLHS